MFQDRVPQGDEVRFCAVSQDDRKRYSGGTETGKGQPGDGNEKDGETHSNHSAASIKRHFVSVNTIELITRK